MSTDLPHLPLSAGDPTAMGSFAEGFEACQGLHAMAALERGQDPVSPLPVALQSAPETYATLAEVQATLQALGRLHPAFAAMATTVAQQDRALSASIPTDVLYEQLAPHAQADCAACDGRGVFYGNVAVCGCVLDPQKAPTPALRESPLGDQRWHHGQGTLVCGGFRVARADWEADVCAAENLREQVFDWMCERLSLPATRS